MYVEQPRTLKQKRYDHWLHICQQLRVTRGMLQLEVENANQLGADSTVGDNATAAWVAMVTKRRQGVSQLTHRKYVAADAIKHAPCSHLDFH